MKSTITISGKLLGKNQPLFSDWCIVLPDETLNARKDFTVRELLTQIILAEIESFRTRQEKRRIAYILSPAEIDQGVRRGKIEMGGQDLIQDVDEEEAIALAMEAFEDGFYFIFIDDKQQDNLDQQVTLKADSQVLFLRLVPLVGG